MEVLRICARLRRGDVRYNISSLVCKTAFARSKFTDKIHSSLEQNCISLHCTFFQAYSQHLYPQEIMAAPLLNQTLHLTATNITSSPTPLPALGNQQSHWDAVAVYGFVFGLLAVLLAVPGAYLAIVALRKHREFEAQLCELDFAA